MGKTKKENLIEKLSYDHAICKLTDRRTYRVSVCEEAQTEALIEVLHLHGKVWYAPRYAGMVGSDGCFLSLEEAIKKVEKKIGVKVVLVNDDLSCGQ